MSSRWSAAVLLAVAAAAVWTVWRLVRGRLPLAVRLVALAAVAVAVFLIIDQHRDAEVAGAHMTSKATIRILPSPPTAESLREESEKIAESLMKRDRLESIPGPGLEAGVSWGFWIGLAGVVLLGVSMAAAGAAEANSR
jgi:hypothetical protein